MSDHTLDNPKQDISTMSEPNVCVNNQLDDIFKQQGETRQTLRELKDTIRIIIGNELNIAPVGKECISCKEFLKKIKECEETTDWVKGELKERTEELRREIQRKDKEIKTLTNINKLENNNQGKVSTFEGNERIVKNQELNNEIEEKEKEITTLKFKINQLESNNQTKLEAHKKNNRLDDIIVEQVETSYTLKELKDMIRIIIDHKLNTATVNKECISCKELLKKIKECEETTDWVRGELKERTEELRREIQRKDKEIKTLTIINQQENKNQGNVSTFKGIELIVRNQELNNEIENRDNEITTLKLKIFQLEVINQKINAELNDKQTELDAHKNQNYELVLWIEECNNEIKKRNEEVETLKSTINQQDLNNEKINTKLNNKQAELMAHKKQNDELVLRIEELSKEIKKKSKEIETLNLTIHQQERNNRKIEAELKEQNNKLIRTIDSLKKEVENKAQEIRISNNDYEAVIAQLREEIKEKDREISKLKTSSSSTTNTSGGRFLDDVLRLNLDPTPSSSGPNLFFQQNNHITYNTGFAASLTKQYSCRYCGRVCKSGAGLASHERSMNCLLGITSPRQIQARSYSSSGYSGYSCYLCGRVCKSGAGLASHERSCANKY